MGADRGQVISHYRLVEKIGEGGMGVVWKAEDTVLNRTVAIKFLPADSALDEERRHMFLDEARLASSVAHGNIVQVHELGREGALDFIVMEFVEGQALSRLLRGRPLPPERVAELGLQISKGLARAHRKGLIHRDLKPANILVTPDGDAKIVDFGLATLFSRQESTATLTAPLTDMTPGSPIAGTLPYMSPEQVGGEALDARSDIFSFGSVLYEMTTGRRPFRGTRPGEIAQEILLSRPQPVQELVPKVPLDLNRIIDKALACRPEDRYQGMDDVAVDLRRLRKDLESGASSSGVATRHVSPTSWHRLGRRVLLGGALVAVVAAGVLVLRRDREPPAPAGVTHARTAIAVLPFQNLSEDGAHAYFAGGLHDELLTQLAKVAALEVISRTSVMGYQGSPKTLRQIADELKVGSIVEGSVQVVSGRLRVNVQLIDAATDNHLWAEHYDRTLDDAFAIQSEVAQEIVRAVGGALTAAEQGRLAKAPTANAEAYRLYLQGRDYYLRPGIRQRDRESAQKLYEQALAVDPNFALARAALSIVHGNMYVMGSDRTEARAARQRDEAEAALRLAPDLPEAHKAMGVKHFAQREYRRALDEFAVALKGLPNDADLCFFIGVTERRVGNLNAALAAFKRGVQLNPRDANLYFYLGGMINRNIRRYADAVRAYDQAVSLVPEWHLAATERAWTYVLWQGQLDTLRATLDRLPGDAELGAAVGDMVSQRAQLYLLERNAESVIRMLDLVGPGSVGPDHWPRSLYLAQAYQLRGDSAAARAAFDSARARLETTIRELPDSYDLHGGLGLALAGSGRREAALREARWLQQSRMYREDPWEGPALAYYRAQILAQAGETEEALEEIERVLSEPSTLSVHMLRLDPIWDPIREDARFQALLAKYGEEGASLE